MKDLFKFLNKLLKLVVIGAIIWAISEHHPILSGMLSTMDTGEDVALEVLLILVFFYVLLVN